MIVASLKAYERAALERTLTLDEPIPIASVDKSARALQTANEPFSARATLDPKPFACAPIAHVPETPKEAYRLALQTAPRIGVKFKKMNNGQVVPTIDVYAF